MKITVFGAGYVGLVTGTCLAGAGNDVLCVDINTQKIDNLNQGVIPICESGLEVMLKENLLAGRLRFTTNIQIGVEHGLFQFITVGTPANEDGSADLSYVLTVAQNIAEHINSYRIIVNKSTVPVGTADKVKTTIQNILKQRNKTIEFDVVSNPEFLKEGVAITDFIKPDRIVIGTDNPRTIELFKTLYAPFNRNHDCIIFMDTRSAELTKYAANAMLATKISFMNELANIAEKVGADIEQVRNGIGSDSRIGYSFIYAGCGYGGSCFPKDVKALVEMAKKQGYYAELITAIESVNTRQKQVLFNKIQQHYQNQLVGKTFALWGLAFKPKTDDMREAPSRILLETLISAGAKVQAYDPEALEEARCIYGDKVGLKLCKTQNEALEGANALCIVTEWRNFWSPDFTLLKTKLIDSVIFDGRNLYDPDLLTSVGIQYYGVGRANKL